jgi:hypothetical protein
MTSSLAGTVQTRLIDLSGLSLADLRRYAPDDVALACARLAGEVAEPAVVTLGGSGS